MLRAPERVPGEAGTHPGPDEPQEVLRGLQEDSENDPLSMEPPTSLLYLLEDSRTWKVSPRVERKKQPSEFENGSSKDLASAHVAGGKAPGQAGEPSTHWVVRGSPETVSLACTAHTLEERCSRLTSLRSSSRKTASLLGRGSQTASHKAVHVQVLAFQSVWGLEQRLWGRVYSFTEPAVKNFINHHR